MSQKPDEELNDVEEQQPEEAEAQEEQQEGGDMAENEEMEDTQQHAAAEDEVEDDQGEEEKDEADEAVQPPPAKKAAAKPKAAGSIKPAAAAGSESKGKKRTNSEVSASSPRSKGGNNAARTRSLSAYFDTTVVARSNAMASKMDKIPTSSVAIIQYNKEHFSAPVVVLGSDIGESGTYELVEPEVEGALQALADFIGTEVVPEDDDEKAANGAADEEKGKGAKKITIKGVATRVPKKNEQYPEWLKDKFGDYKFISNCHGRYIRHKETGVIRLVHNATIVPAIGALFVSLLSSKTRIAIGNEELKPTDLQIRLAHTQSAHASSASEEDDEHLYVELFDKPGEITSYPCERAFLASMPLDVLLSHSEKLPGYLAPRFLYNQLAKMSNTDKSSKKSKTKDEEEVAESAPSTTKASTKKRNAKADAAAQSAITVDLPVRQRDAVKGADDEEHHANGVASEVTRNCTNFAALERIGKKFGTEMAAHLKEFEARRKAADDLVSSTPNSARFYPVSPPAMSDSDPKTEANKKFYNQFVASLDDGNALRLMAKSLVFVPDQKARAERIQKTLLATSLCIAAKSETVSEAKPADLAKEFERVIDLFSTASDAQWRKYVTAEKELDLVGFMKVYANQKASPLCRALFMTGFVAGVCIGADEMTKTTHSMAKSVTEVTKFYSGQLTHASTSLSDLIRESNIEMAKAQKAITTRHEKENVQLTKERDDLKRELEKVNALLAGAHKTLASSQESEESYKSKIEALTAENKKLVRELEAARSSTGVVAVPKPKVAAAPASKPAAPKAAAAPKSAPPAAAPEKVKPPPKAAATPSKPKAPAVPVKVEQPPAEEKPSGDDGDADADFA